MQRAPRSVLWSILILSVTLFPSATVPRRGTEIHIAFSGIICHVFDGQHAPRAVAMRGSPGMEHRATLHVAQASIASSDVALSCQQGDCVLDLTDVALRFLGSSGRPRVTAGGSFDTIVPHLQRVTNEEMRTLRDDVFDAVPSPGGVVSASMELPSGALSATPYDMTGRYDPDFEQRGDRPFAHEVFLDGVVAQPLLLVRRSGDASWHRIKFKDDELIELRMVNEPANGMEGEHALLYYDLAELPLATKPLIVSSRAAGQMRPHGLDIACSPTSWP